MTTHLTDAELLAALALAEKATAGPVKYGRNAAHGWRLYSEPSGDLIALGIGSFPTEGDAAFYAAARTGWPAAAKALLEARAALRDLVWACNDVPTYRPGSEFEQALAKARATLDE